MKICYRENKEAKWRRGGVNISYVNANEEDEEKNYQLHFTYFFKNNENSSVEFAYAFPYGLKKLQNLIAYIQPKVKMQLLGRTYEGRDIPLLNIGNPNSK
jgi:murein tripeptide amidase MpaA